MYTFCHETSFVLVFVFIGTKTRFCVDIHPMHSPVNLNYVMSGNFQFIGGGVAAVGYFSSEGGG